jgi:cytochrome P450
MQFLERLKSEGEAALAHVQGDIMAAIDQLKANTLAHPEPLFAVLRKVKPILLVKNVALVTRFEDVQEVLSRDDIFQVTYGPKMRVITGGQDFFLGMANSPEYERDTAHMRSVVRRQDMAGIAAFVESTARQIVESSDGSMDVVTDLSRVAPARWIADYFGCVPPSEKQLADWGTVIFQYLFTDLDNNPEVGRIAQAAAAEARAWLDGCIAARKAAGTTQDDVLGRCLALQRAGMPGMDDLSIRDNLIGLIVGAIPTTSKCCANALDQLFDRPAQLAAAQEAAASGDDALFSRFVFEALRFNPNNPGVFRIAGEDYTVAKGTMRATTIPKGAFVIAATQSAMLDESKVDAPTEFRTDRPAWNYMHWGYGLHTCFGQYINQTQIPLILKPLLATRSVQRAGVLQVQGPFPSSLRVTYRLGAAAVT